MEPCLCVWSLHLELTLISLCFSLSPSPFCAIKCLSYLLPSSYPDFSSFPQVPFTLGLLSQDSVWARPPLVAGFSVTPSSSVSAPSLSQAAHLAHGPPCGWCLGSWCARTCCPCAPQRPAVLAPVGVVPAGGFSLLETTCGKCHLFISYKTVILTWILSTFSSDSYLTGALPQFAGRL